MQISWPGVIGAPLTEAIRAAGSPRTGPNHLQNYPILLSAADGTIRGWIYGSLPDATYEVDVYAGPAYEPDGSAQAPSFLGSLAVTTDATGQATFLVPFTPPADGPAITATATDPAGNTSEFAPAPAAPTLNLPGPVVRAAPEAPVVFSSAQGRAIAVSDPAAGSIDRPAELTLSVGAGTLTNATGHHAVVWSPACSFTSGRGPSPARATGAGRSTIAARSVRSRPRCAA